MKVMTDNAYNLLNMGVQPLYSGFMAGHMHLIGSQGHGVSMIGHMHLIGSQGHGVSMIGHMHLGVWSGVLSAGERIWCATAPVWCAITPVWWAITPVWSAITPV